MLNEKWKIHLSSFEIHTNSCELIVTDFILKMCIHITYIDNVKHERNGFYEPFDVMLSVEDVVLSVDGVILKQMHFT